MADKTREREYAAEAERLALLPVADQREIIALHWSVANDEKVSADNRKEARARAKALQKLLKLGPKKKG